MQSAVQKEVSQEYLEELRGQVIYSEDKSDRGKILRITPCPCGFLSLHVQWEDEPATYSICLKNVDMYNAGAETPAFLIVNHYTRLECAHPSIRSTI